MAPACCRKVVLSVVSNVVAQILPIAFFPRKQGALIREARQRGLLEPCVRRGRVETQQRQPDPRRPVRETSHRAARDGQPCSLRGAQLQKTLPAKHCLLRKLWLARMPPQCQQ